MDGAITETAVGFLQIVMVKDAAVDNRHADSGSIQTKLLRSDVIHHRIQLAFPELSTVADTDRALARTTRTALIERLADMPTVLLPAHFPPPVFGRVVRSEVGFAYAPVEG